MKTETVRTPAAPAPSARPAEGAAPASQPSSQPPSAEARGNPATAFSSAAPRENKVALPSVGGTQLPPGFRADEAAEKLHGLARPGFPPMRDQTRIDEMEKLFSGMDRAQVDTVKAAYIERYDADPEMDLRGNNFGQVFDLDPATEEKMVRAMNGPAVREQVVAVVHLLDLSEHGPLTVEDREAFFGQMAAVGYPYGRDHLSDELKRHTGKTLDQAMSALVSEMPPPRMEQTAPPERSVAVVVSSKGAQWQELMDWAKPMVDAGYHLQFFTADGNPVGIQGDSMLYSEKTGGLGFGSPPHLRFDGDVGRLGVDLASKAAPATAFDPSKFGQVYLAGGLGTDRDLTFSPNIHGMVQRAFDAGLDISAICHGPTILAHTMIDPQGDGTTEPVAKGLNMVGLPNILETYAIAGGRVPDVFLNPPPINVRETLAAAGANVSRFTDLQSVMHQDRVVTDEKAGRRIATGVGPLAARNLAEESIRLLESRAARAASRD